MLRWIFDSDCWEYITGLHVAVLFMLIVGISAAIFALFDAPTRWLGVSCLILAAAGTFQMRIADDFLEQQEHFWDATKFPDGPPSVWMRNVTMDESPSWRAHARRQIFQNPNVGISLIAISTAAGVIALLV